MRKFFADNWITIVISVALISSTALAIRNTFIIKKNQVVIQQTELVKENTQEVLTRIMHGLDLGVRGYGITQDEQLLTPYREAVSVTPGIFRKIDSLLAIQGYPQRGEALDVMKEVKLYTAFCDGMIEDVNRGQTDQFVSKLKEDRGYQVWSQYANFSEPLFEFERKLHSNALEAYDAAVLLNLILQIAISVLGIPLLFLFVRSIVRERHKRKQVLETVDFADRNFVFNDGSAAAFRSEQVNERVINHVKIASYFVASLTEDKYDVEWSGMSAANQQLNTSTLAGNLVRLRERLKYVKIDDQRRNWINEGLTRFTQLVRANQQSPERLANESVSFLTKYIQAQQGSLFVVTQENGERCLRLESCFAFIRRKFIEKTVPIGNGIIGQVYLEGSTTVLTDVPRNYTTITSGLGEATPTCIVVVPLKTNEETVAVAEFATFKQVKDFEIGFLERAGEFLASTIVNARASEKMKTLLEEAERREAIIRQSEEELRQNMEELSATQEQMERERTYLSK